MTTLKYDPKNLFEFYLKAFTKCGATIHKHIHQYGGDIDENSWPQGYYLFFLMNLTYKGRTGWYYHRGDRCSGCWPEAFFNGSDEFDDIQKDEGCINRWGTCDELCKCCYNEKIYKEYKEIGVPDNVLQTFVDEHFVDYQYSCDNCHKIITTRVIHRCVDCADKMKLIDEEFEDTFTIDFCLECVSLQPLKIKGFDSKKVIHTCEHVIEKVINDPSTILIEKEDIIKELDNENVHIEEFDQIIASFKEFINN